MGGVRDTVLATPLAEAEIAQRAIAGAELQVLEDAYHLANLQQAEAFNRALVGFLGQQARVAT